ncbi:MAG: HD domain-containing protein [Candidatus Promineifilaceae bacterium]
MEERHIVNLLLNGIRLKQMPRTGWLQRGVPQAENVAAHSYGVSLTALALIEAINQPFAVARVLAMAVLHDLPESLTSDIPAPVKRFMGDKDAKTNMERLALLEITDDVSFGGSWRALWEEYAAEESAESKLVHDADKIDMFLQALTYEQQTGNRLLDQFWQVPYTFFYPEAQSLYDYLRAAHENLKR